MESCSIYETWHWAPLAPSARLHAKVMSAAGQVSRQDYYHQDGRPAFSSLVYGRFEKFIEHFTELDHEEFRNAVRRMRHDGPGFIEDFAAFCSGEEVPEIEVPSLDEVVDESKDEQDDGRCVAMTKSGGRCKNKAIDNSNYCSKHQEYEKVEEDELSGEDEPAEEEPVEETGTDEEDNY